MERRFNTLSRNCTVLLAKICMEQIKRAPWREKCLFSAHQCRAEAERGMKGYTGLGNRFALPLSGTGEKGTAHDIRLHCNRYKLLICITSLKKNRLNFEKYGENEVKFQEKFICLLQSKLPVVYYH